MNKWNVVLAFVVLVVGAIAPMTPAATWTTPGGDITGAPTVYAGADQLIDARRAAGDANSQAGFLVQGTERLREGTDELAGGTGELTDAIAAASEGANQLSQGMVELQAGTGQLADGATRLADTVGGAVNQLVGFEAVRGQVLAAIDDALESTRDNRDPQVVDLRNQLGGLRQQVETAQLPEEMTGQLTELKDGSRELANQLGVSGYGYHDGVYTATNGAAELAAGLGELNGRVGEATGGIDEAVEGVGKIDELANTTKERIEAVQRALPAAAPVAGAAATDAAAAAEENAPSSSLAPLAAMLVSALAILSGAAAALAAYAARRPRGHGDPRWSIIGWSTGFTTVAGLVLIMILGTGLSPLAVAISGLALALAMLASAGVTWIFRSSFGPTGGTAAAGLFALLQMGVVGWVWSTASTGSITLLWETISSAMPMHWATTAISAAGNGGSSTAMWVGIGMSAIMALLGMMAIATDDPDADEYDAYERAGHEASEPESRYDRNEYGEYEVDQVDSTEAYYEPEHQTTVFEPANATASADSQQAGEGEPAFADVPKKRRSRVIPPRR